MTGQLQVSREETGTAVVEEQDISLRAKTVHEYA